MGDKVEGRKVRKGKSESSEHGKDAVQSYELWWWSKCITKQGIWVDSRIWEQSTFYSLQRHKHLSSHLHGIEFWPNLHEQGVFPQNFQIWTHTCCHIALALWALPEGPAKSHCTCTSDEKNHEKIALYCFKLLSLQSSLLATVEK